VSVAEREPRADSRAALPTNWPWLFEWFRGYAGGYMGRHFHAVRLSRTGPAPDVGDRPVLVVLNHPSWWDPLFCFRLSTLFPKHRHYAPIDAKALERYGILGKVGLFGIDPGTVRGAAGFLRTAKNILSRPRMALWVTAQGHFVDARRRPPGLQPGVGHLAHRLTDGVIVPVALEYPFWDERTPEALARFGEPIDLAVGRCPDAEAWTVRIEEALARTQDALAAEAASRDPSLFVEMVRGRVGIGGVYDVWRRLAAWVRGRRFEPGHGEKG
jgi:1-acyl-sn-glycerol-3-phosphate acyltransferase